MRATNCNYQHCKPRGDAGGGTSQKGLGCITDLHPALVCLIKGPLGGVDPGLVALFQFPHGVFVLQMGLLLDVRIVLRSLGKLQETTTQSDQCRKTAIGHRPCFPSSPRLCRTSTLKACRPPVSLPLLVRPPPVSCPSPGPQTAP